MIGNPSLISENKKEVISEKGLGLVEEGADKSVDGNFALGISGQEYEKGVNGDRAVG